MLEFLITARKRSCGKVMFLHLSVIPSVHRGDGERGCGGGDVVATLWTQRHTSLRTQRQTPPAPKSSHPPDPEAEYPLYPEADTPPPGPRGRHPPGPRSSHRTVEMATEAGDTHPTGMHSCFKC